MSFDELVQVRTTKKKTKLGERGCANCTLNKVPGVQKIMGTLAGKDILIVGQSPGPEENDAGKELVGKSGKFLWAELKAVGIERSDCDVFNTVRCFPAVVTEGSYNTFLKMRNPTPLEIHCCSIHTETAMQQSTAKHILILGKVAQLAFLEVRSAPAQKIFWSDKYQAKIYLADHPSFFIRGYGAGDRLEAFRSTLAQLSSDRQNKEVVKSDNFAYLREQDYRLVSTKKQAVDAERIIRAYAKKGRRISVDIEYDHVPDLVVFAVGFSPKPGLSFTFVFDYPMVDQSESDKKSAQAVVAGLLADADVKKVFHYGCSDVETLKKIRFDVRGFDWDTYISEYLWYPDAKAYGLDEVSERRHQQFSGYKMIIASDLMEALPPDTKVPAAVLDGAPSVKLRWLSKTGNYHLSRIKPDTLRLYNGADADLTKRLEIDGKKRVPWATVQMYIDLSFVLKDMEPNGPYFDGWQADQLMRLYPYLADKQLKKLRKMVGNPEFNPGSSQQVFDVIYDHFGLEYPLSKGKPNTQKKTMLMLGREHPFPPEVVEWRKLSKAKSTIEGYKEVALKAGGRLVTKWKIDGTSTGRLSSSGGKDKVGTNLQNVPNTPWMQNMLVADTRWRVVFNAITAIRKTVKKEYWEQRIEAWIRKHMPDLKTFLVLDYGQIEIRVLALLSGDKNLIADCAKGDIHTSVGVTMTGWDPEKIRHDKKTRTLTKNCIAEGQLVLTDCGLIPIEKVECWHSVWDGVEWVSHGGVEFMGVRSVIEYDGLKATPDHKVWTSSGLKMRFSDAAARRLELAVTAVEAHTVRYADDYFEEDSSKTGNALSVCLCDMSRVRGDARDNRRYYSAQIDKRVQVSEEPEIQRSTRASVSGSLLCDPATLRESAEPELGWLRRTRNTESFSLRRSFREVHHGVSSSSDVQGRRDRSEEQRRSLRAGKYKSRDEVGQRSEYTQDSVCEVQEREFSCDRGCATTEAGLPGDDVIFREGSISVADRRPVAGSEGTQRSRHVQETRVYDILNAGPRRRFTVGGHLVSNCHFGIVFLIAKQNLYQFIKAMDPTSDVTEEFVFDAYDRYFERYTGVKTYMDDRQEFAQEHGYVETLFGLHRVLNVTDNRSSYDGEGDDDELDVVAMKEGKQVSWRSQSINTGVQGTAHQLLECGLVNHRRKPNKYKILGAPVMDVHDALYYRVDVLTLQESYRAARYLMEQESLATVKKDFPKIDWTVPIVVEAEAGLRLGGKVPLEDDKFTVGKFMLEWYEITKKQIIDLKKQLSQVPDVAVNG